MSVILDVELKRRKHKFLYICITAFLILGALVEFMPLYWLAIGTFKGNPELMNAIPTFWPKTFTIEAWENAFSDFDILNNVYNTIFVCAGVIILQTIFSTMAAFALSKVRMGGKAILHTIILGTQMFSATALMFPTYIMLAKAGMIGNKFSWILMASGWGYAILLYKSFFDNLPKELFEAAEIDGAGTMKQIFHIAMPLSKPIYSVMILNTFMSVYNDFLLPIMILPEEKDWTLMMRIFMMDKAGLTEPNVMYVLLLVTSIPSIVFYLIAQKNIVKGVSTSGMKG